MPSFKEIVSEGTEVKKWEEGVVFEFEDKYYWLNTEKKEVVLKGNFL